MGGGPRGEQPADGGAVGSGLPLPHVLCSWPEAEKAQGDNRAMYNLRTWLGDGGQSSVDVKLLCAEEKSLLLSVLLLKGKVPAEACCALGGSAVSCDPSVRRITPLRGLESLQRVSSLSSDTWSGAQLSALSSSLSLALSSGKLLYPKLRMLPVLLQPEFPPLRTHCGRRQVPCLPLATSHEHTFEGAGFQGAMPKVP